MPLHKVLILAYYYPPSHNVASFRTESWTENFIHSGLKPTVITSLQQPGHIVYENSDDCKVFRVPCKSDKHKRFRNGLVTSLNVLWQILSTHLFLASDTYSPIYMKAKEELDKESYDLIIVTGAPFVLFQFASRLSRKFNIPWVSDYRDGWSTNAEYLIKNSRKKKLKKFYQILEKRALRSVSTITTVTSEVAEKLQELHPSKDIEIVYNGFYIRDFDQPNQSDYKPSEGVLNITYMGTLYAWQPVEFFLRGVEEFAAHEGSPEVLVKFIGLASQVVQYKRVLDLSNQFEGKVKYQFTKRLPRTEAIESCLKSDVLLFLVNPDLPQLSAKIFDYFASQKPIIVAERGQPMISRLPTVFSEKMRFCDTTEETVKALWEIHHDKFSATPFSKKLLSTLEFSREKQAKKMAEIALSLINEEQGHESEPDTGLQRLPLSKDRKLRALIICQYFHPSNAVSAHRPLSWTRYFPDHDMTCDVVCINTEGAVAEQMLPSGTKITRVEEYKSPIRKLFRRIPLIKVLADVFLNFFVNQGEFRNIYATGKKVMASEQYDVIIATGAPFVLFKYAKKLSRLSGVPWVADYRDGWSTNGEYHIGGTKQFVLRPLYSFIEKKTMKSAVLLTSAASNYSTLIKKLHPEKQVKTIWNGFFEEDFQGMENLQSQERGLSIAYLGTLYHFQPVEIFVKGLLSWCEHTGKKASLCFLGLGSQVIQKKRVEMLLKDHHDKVNLQILPKVDRAEALKKAATMKCLLLLCDDVITQLPAKTFDYMALQKPIMVVKNDHSIVNSLLKDNPKAYFLDTEEAVKIALSRIDEGEGASGFSKEQLEKLTYNRRTQAAIFHKAIKERIGG